MSLDDALGQCYRCGLKMHFEHLQYRDTPTGSQLFCVVCLVAESADDDVEEQIIRDENDPWKQPCMGDGCLTADPGHSLAECLSIHDAEAYAEMEAAHVLAEQWEAADLARVLVENQPVFASKLATALFLISREGG